MSREKKYILLKDTSRRLAITQRPDGYYTIREEYYYRTEYEGDVIAKGWARLPSEGIYETFELAFREAKIVAKSR